MMKETSENGTDLSADDIGTIEEIPEDTILSRQTSVNLVPFIGQRFVSQDAAYEFYCSFAKQCGFSIRRHRTRGKDGVGRGITRRDFTCHRGGYPQSKPSEDIKPQRNRKSSRCGCQAYMRIVKRSDFDVPEWRITGFSNIHNHDLLKSNDVHALVPSSYSTMSSDDKSRICMFSKAGMSVRQMLRLLELEKGVKLGCLPFTEIDVRNLVQSFRNIDRDCDSDPIDLLKLCKDMKDKDPFFKYNFKIDSNNRLDHIAWTYPSSLQSFNLFGDLVIFDTTHRLDSYDMILGVFLGVDNHGSNCFFGCVLLRDENIESFRWGLKTFLSFVGKVPETILTDQNMWLKEAVAIELPRTKHAFCIWQIVSKFSDWFSVVLGSRYDEWKVEFHGLYNLHLVDEFEMGWREMVDGYGLHGNKHIVSLYALRTYWALPFLRCYFFAGMTSTLQPDSINGFIQRFLSAQSVLDNFIEQVAAVINQKDQPTTKQKTIQTPQKITLKTGSPIESHAATVLTPYAFTKLQHQLVLAPQYASLLVDESYFIVRHHTETYGGSKVIWIPDDEFISCSCHDFEFSGILCRHVLRVLSTNNCFNVPYQYLPVRWRDGPLQNDENALGVLEGMVAGLVAEAVESEERLRFVAGQVGMVLARVKEFPGGYDDGTQDSLIVPEVEDSGIVQGFGSLGKLKERRCKRRAACFGQFGHRQGSSELEPCPPCPLMGSGSMDGDGMGFL